MRTRITVIILSLFAVLLLLSSCGGKNGRVIEDSQVRLEITPQGGIALTYNGEHATVPLSKGETAAFYLLATDGSSVPLIPGKSQHGSDRTGRPVRAG